MDLLSFIGVRRVRNIAKLVWNPYNARVGRHIRVLGAVQPAPHHNTKEINMTIAHSCTEEGTVKYADSDGLRAECFRFEYSTWDTEQDRFSCSPTLNAVPTWYRSDGDCGET